MAAAGNPRDPDARVAVKRKKSYFGYKAHLAVDEESGLVRQAEITSANVHDFRLAETLIQGDEQGVFADKAYDSQAFHTLESRGLVDGVAWKARRGQPLEAWQRSLNAWSSSIRYAVVAKARHTEASSSAARGTRATATANSVARPRRSMPTTATPA